MNYIDYVVILKALADETRLKIVHLLKGGELCACNILDHFSITQPTLSYHMKILCESGVVNGVRNGAWMYYSLNKDVINSISELFINLLAIDSNEDQLKRDCTC
jgi:ArsR family transcriptional regulator